MEEDRYTNTPEDAAEFERRRAIDAGEWDDERPTPAELAEDEELRRLEAQVELLQRTNAALEHALLYDMADLRNRLRSLTRFLRGHLDA